MYLGSEDLNRIWVLLLTSEMSFLSFISLWNPYFFLSFFFCLLTSSYNSHSIIFNPSPSLHILLMQLFHTWNF